MKKNSILALLILFVSFTQINAQVSQFIGKMISYQPYNSSSKTYSGEWSPFMDYPCIVEWDYVGKTMNIYNTYEGVYMIQAKYKEEVNPDKIKGTETNLFLFDPASNKIGLKAVRIFVQGDGTFKYHVEYKTEKAEISGIEPDENFDGTGDYSATTITENNTYSQGGQNIRYLYFKNTTSYDVYVGTSTLPNAYGDWVVSSWIKIPAGTSGKIGESAEEYFYYYAYCRDSNSQFLTWEGKEQYNKVGTDGPYAFRKINLSEGKQDENNNWTLDLFITK